MSNLTNSSIYGPVKSWRLGWSLGVDVLLVDSICSFQCVYCQLGKIHQHTNNREVFVPTEKIISDLKDKDWKKADVITFSGSGEPTLAANLGETIKKIKELTRKKIVVLTNSTLLYKPEVRKELHHADKIFCKLDAWSDEVLRRIDRPVNGISLEKIISGIHLLRNEFNGFMAIQTMIMRKLTEFEIEELADIYCTIRPDEVQLNLPSRPIPKNYFIQTRGNEVEFDESFTRLKTITKDDLEDIRVKLSQLTHLQIITR